MLRSRFAAAFAHHRLRVLSSTGPSFLGSTTPFQGRLFASNFDGERSKGKPKTKPKQKKITKWKLNPNITQENADRLSAAFDELATKDGFDASTAIYADDATFEDDFEIGDGDDLNGDLEADDDEDLDQDMSFDHDDDDDDDDFLDFSEPGQTMEERIAAAQRDMDLGTISVPKGLDKFSDVATFDQLKKLGYKREVNPFGNDETPRKEQFKLTANALTCSACGSDFQSQRETKPGYLPPEKHEIQRKLAKIEQMQKLQEKAENSVEWSSEDEVDYLLKASDGKSTSGEFDDFAMLDIDSAAEQMGLDLVELSKKKVICKRCHGLQNFGKVEEALRPGWTDEPLLSQKQFRDLLLPLKEKPAVIIAIVDLFDFSGSVLPELDSIAGNNPVLLAANKADLLPDKLGPNRAQNWVRRELEYLRVQSIANIGGSVRLISCKTGFGIADLLRRARTLADEMQCEIYVVGAANAGKSSFINHVLERNDMTPEKKEELSKKRPGNETARKGMLTTSPLPGTTLKFIKIKLGDGQVMYDTPGLLIPGTLTQLLTPEELKIVVPKKKVEPITFRFGAGKCVLVGGLARIEVIGDTLPFLFTFYVANGIKLHPTDSSRAESFIEAHAGKMLTPPLEPGPERMAQIGEFEEHIVEIDGIGWKEAAADITLRGLGWVAVTGSGKAKLRIMVPKGIGISIRPPLMPFDIWETTARYTGGRAVRKSSKSKSGKRRSGVGRN